MRRNEEEVLQSEPPPDNEGILADDQAGSIKEATEQSPAPSSYDSDCAENERMEADEPEEEYLRLTQLLQERPGLDE